MLDAILVVFVEMLEVNWVIKWGKWDVYNGETSHGS